MARIVDLNIRALLARHEENERKKSFSDRLADRITAFAGSMRFVLVVFGLWMMTNI